ncbi:hypothetical protein Tco_0026442 [Tanacetum coccineum]
MPPEDEVLPAEEQPLPATVLPTTDSPSYVPESDPEEDPEEDDDEDPKEDPADYPVDVGDDGDDEDKSSNEDEDDEDVDIEGDKEEEEHPAPGDSTVVALPAIDHTPSTKETKSFETDEFAADTPSTTSCISDILKKLAIGKLSIALGSRYEVVESSSAPTARPPRGGSTAGSDYRVTSSGPQETGGDLQRCWQQTARDRHSSLRH